MGAFCSSKNSLFRRRRKGRNGPDIWTERTGPPLAGVKIRYAAGAPNPSVMVCGTNAATSCQISRDGAGSWSALAIVAPNFIGNAANGGTCLVARPSSNPELGAVGFNRFDGAGAHPGIGGACTVIDKDARFTLESYTVAGNPQESIAWSPNNDYRITVGAVTAGNAKCTGVRINSGPEPFNIPTAVALGCGETIYLSTPFHAPPSWIVGDLAAAGDTAPFHIVRRRLNNDWPVVNIAQSHLGFSAKQFIQNGAIVIAIDQANEGINRSLDYGQTFSFISTGVANSPQENIFRHGGRLFMLRRDSPRVIVSSNNGATWAAFTPALPSATAEPSVSCIWQDERYIFCRDGAVNRVYKFKTRNEI